MLKTKSGKWKNIALSYIRENVTLDRIKEVEETLSDWNGNLLDLDDYFNQILMESIYRSHKGSYKIDSSKCRGLVSLGFILYILFGEPKFNPNEVIDVVDDKVRKKFRQVLRKRFEKDSYFLRYSLTFLEVEVGDRDEKSARTRYLELLSRLINVIATSRLNEKNSYLSVISATDEDLEKGIERWEKLVDLRKTLYIGTEREIHSVNEKILQEIIKLGSVKTTELESARAINPFHLRRLSVVVEGYVDVFHEAAFNLSSDGDTYS